MYCSKAELYKAHQNVALLTSIMHFLFLACVAVFSCPLYNSHCFHIAMTRCHRSHRGHLGVCYSQKHRLPPIHHSSSFELMSISKYSNILSKFNFNSFCFLSNEYFPIFPPNVIKSHMKVYR